MTIGSKFLSKTLDQVKMIREKLKVAQDRQNPYADIERRFDEFQVGKKVVLGVSYMKSVILLGRRGTLSPRFYLIL